MTDVIVGALRGEERVVCYLPDNASITTLAGCGEDLRLVELGQQFRTRVN